MGSNEEYLDKLLQSVTDEEKKAAPAEVEQKEYSEDMTDEELLASLIEMYSEELAEFKAEEIIHKDDSQSTENMPENIAENVAEAADNVESSEMIEESVMSEIISEEATEPVADASEEVEDDTFFIDHGEQLSQSDIEALLNNLENNLMEATEQSAASEEILKEDNAFADISDAEEKADDSLLKDMGLDELSAEEIEKMLNAAQEAEVKPQEDTAVSNEMNLDALFGGLGFDNGFDSDSNSENDIADLLGGMLGEAQDDELAEIGALLQKADSQESLNDSNLRSILDSSDDIGGNDLLNELLTSDKIEESEGKKKKEKVKKAKKEKTTKDKAPKEKGDGKSLWNRITAALFEEEDDLDDIREVKIAGGDGFISIANPDENVNILEELMNEDLNKGKKSKKKKDKSKDKGKAKAEAKTEGAEGEEVLDPKEQAKLEKQKAKAEKAAAKKKAREEKAEADRAFLKAQPSISTKRAATAFIFALSIMAVILVIYMFVPDMIDKKNARKAYYSKDYYEAYELLKGKELNDSDTILLNKVTCILKLYRKYEAYCNYDKMGKNVEALNALMEAVNEYQESHTYAKAMAIDKETDAIYAEVLIILSGKYGVSEEYAKEVIALESDAEYTLRLQYILDGNAWPDAEEAPIEEGPMEDILPEEEDFFEGREEEFLEGQEDDSNN